MQFRTRPSLLAFVVVVCSTWNAALSHLPLVPQASSLVSAECQTLTQQCSDELGLFAAGNSQTSSSSSSSSTPSPSALEPVCGSDGRTYSSRCELQRARCNGHQIRVKYRGACHGEEKRCKHERRLAQRTARRQNETTHGAGGKKAIHNGETFIPECTEDGSFAEIQCHRATGYCWCVSPDGKPISGSSVLNSKPNCKRQSKPTPRRRSPQGKKPRKGCTPEDKAAFNGHLIRMFTTEFNRLPTTPMPSPAFAQLDGVSETVERRVIDWKFDVFDKNGDGLLNRPEYRVLRQLVQKVVRPKRCAKNFPRHCDTDEDRKISRSEWSVCLGIGVNSGGDSSAEDSDSAAMDSGMSILRNIDRILQSTKHASLPTPQDTSSLEETDTAEANDCYSERQAALEEVKHGTQDMYVPECTPDNKYQRVQCHAGYCWCANDETGRLIPGTSTNNSKPTNCDNLPAHLLNRSTTPRPTYRPLLAEEACPGRRKAQLQEELMKYLRESLNNYLINVTNTNPNSIVEPDYSLPIKERVGKWHLKQLDANKNNFIDRQETKSLRLLLKRSPKLRRCSKKIPAFCDINGDKRISADEWLQCLGVAKSNRHNVASPIVQASGSVKGKRLGPNPLSTFLKENR